MLSNKDIVHLQKAAPKHWFEAGEKIRVKNCPTRFGPLSWTTESAARKGSRPKWRVTIQWTSDLGETLVVYIHPPDRGPLESASSGELHPDRIVLSAPLLAGKKTLVIEVK